jgi:hypothetical protein
MKTCGVSIGSGAQKTAYEVVGKKSLVALVPHSQLNDVRHEIRILKQLQKMGIPVLKAKYASVMCNGTKQKAMLVPRYDFHSFDNYYERMNNLHVRRLKKMKAKIDKLGIVISDSQYLFKKNGEVVLADPRGYMPVAAYGYNATASQIESMIMAYYAHRSRESIRKLGTRPMKRAA